MKLFVGGPNFDTDRETLARRAEALGGVAEDAMVVDRMAGCSRGFGLVTFVDHAAGAAVAENTTGRVLDHGTRHLDQRMERASHPFGRARASFLSNAFGNDRSPNGRSRNSNESDRW